MAPGGAREIVDRTEIVATLENDCLLGGVSTAIVARHKMGKSFLLQHLHNRWPKLAAASDALFCHITLARLRETLGADEPLTDSVFYRYMIRELATQLQDRIMSDRQRWQLQIDSNNAQLATISADDPLRDAVSEQTSDFNAKLAGLSDLERLLVAMRIPLSRSRPVGKLDLVKILDELNELHKRVMLLVDDLHHFLEKNEFSDDLYQFVRGGDKVGNIVALFSVPVRPRDLQLHSKQLAKGREALFNHIQPKPLPPFSDTDVAAYFNHLYPDETLTAEEGRYLFELGGGSPQFLLVAYNLFVLRQHPTRVERVAFEAELAKAFQKGFQEIWAWCDDTEKAVLRNVAQFSATEDTLARQNLISSGYLIPARPTNQAKMFSNLFVDFVREQIRVRVKAELPFDVLPTALFFAQPKKAEPLVTFVLDNPTAERMRVKIECELQNYSQSVEETVTLEPFAENVRKMLQVVLMPAQIEALRGAANARVRYDATLLSQGKELDFDRTNKFVRMLPRDQFTFARFNQDAQEQIDESWLITAWVSTRGGVKFDQVRALAGAKYTLEGYQSDAAGVERQVQSLYEALKEQGLRYETAPPGFGWDPNPDQRVRFPADSLEEGAVNCLDAVVLFASLLEASSLDPLILLMPRHAVVGWKESRSGASMRFLDIAEIGRHNFKDACAAGQKSFTESERLRFESAAYLRQDPPIIKEPERFCVLIDVRDVRKRWGVVPF